MLKFLLLRNLNWKWAINEIRALKLTQKSKWNGIYIQFHLRDFKFISETKLDMEFADL